MSTQLQPGNEVSIRVTARNNGSSYENFTVTLLDGNEKIKEQTIQNLPPQTNIDLFFAWDTSVNASGTHTIKALASGVENETSPSNNLLEKQITLNSNANPTVTNSSLTLPIAAAGAAIALSPVGFIIYKKRKTTPTPRTTTRKKKASSHEQFKEMVGGDFPPGSTILVTGNPGSGKSILAQFLALQFLNEGKACIFVTYDELPAEIRKHLKSLNLDITRFEKNQAFTIIDCYSSRAKATSQEKYYVEQPFSPTDLSITISTALEENPEKTKVLIIDSATALFTKLDFQKVMRLLQDRSAKIKANGNIFILTLGKDTVAQSLTNRLEEAVDGIIELDLVEVQGKMVRRMRIKKLRGQNHLEEWANFTIDPNHGINFVTK
jgi:KaiC/GvpD/RAD55 family RecA-like ATPase